MVLTLEEAVCITVSRALLIRSGCGRTVVPVRGCGRGGGGGFCGVHIVAGAPAHQAGAAHPVLSPTRPRDAAGNEEFYISLLYLHCQWVAIRPSPCRTAHAAAHIVQAWIAALGGVTMQLLGSLFADPSW